MSTTSGRESSQSASPKKVALTFDDGPNPPYTNQILDILNKEGIKATFFVCGKNAQEYPHLVRRMAKEGHLVANHSWNHQYLPSVLGLTYKEIAETETLITQLTGQKNKLFRPPWGKIPPWTKSKLESEGFKIISWNIMADYTNPLGIAIKQGAEIVSRTANAKEGDIIIFHDREPASKSLQKVISSLKEKSFTFAVI